MEFSYFVTQCHHTAFPKGSVRALLYMRMGLVKRRILECSSQYLGNNRRYGPDYWPDRESHTGCRLIPVLMTLNDRELSENEHIGAYYQRQKDSHMSVNVKTARTGTSRSNGGVISPDSRSIPNSRFSTNYVNNRLTESRIWMSSSMTSLSFVETEAFKMSTGRDAHATLSVKKTVMLLKMLYWYAESSSQRAADSRRCGHTHWLKWSCVKICRWQKPVHDGAPKYLTRKWRLLMRRTKWKSEAHAVGLEFVYEAHSNRRWNLDKPLWSPRLLANHAVEALHLPSPHKFKVYRHQLAR